MRLGIDFGTTRIVVAAVDRGNYPVVNFETPQGDTLDWYPPLVAARDNERLYGWDAWAAQGKPGYTVVRSIKRYLDGSGPGTRVRIGEQSLPMRQLLAEMMTRFRLHLEQHSSLNATRGETLEVMLGVPANANSNQRFLTVEAFREAGFSVLGLLNEPSAASIEFGHRSRKERAAATKQFVLVYDLGGGTFDVSLVELDAQTHSVVATEGIPTLGGDDFDEALGELALELGAIPPEQRDGLTQAELFLLHEECREKKESLHPNTRKLVIDLERVRENWPSVSVPAATYYDRCQPLVEETMHAVDDLLAKAAHSTGVDTADALYITGGGSELPVVARLLRERYGRRTRRSTYTRSATAIGLAIQADTTASYVLRERFSRQFGVWREGDSGKRVIFDPLFDRGTPLPLSGQAPLTISRCYNPVHNIGHFRYLECIDQTSDGQPAGDITYWDEIRFPFESSLAEQADLSQVPVVYSPEAADQIIEETYSCDQSGGVNVTIRNLTTGYMREYRLARWAAGVEPLVPTKHKQKARPAKAAAPEEHR
jgi:molecular chaperone DnaK (HSP70)